MRKHYGISRAAGVQALETLIGTRTVEIKGTVKGSFRVGDHGSLMVERSDGDTIIIDADTVPDWLQGNEVPARLIVRASRSDESAQVHAVLLGAAPEQDIKAIEDVAAAKEAAKRRSAQQAASRRGVRAPAHERDWSLPASEVTPIYAAFIKKHNGRLSNNEAMRIAQGVIGFSMRYGVDARLIMAMVSVESGFNPSAISSAGAMGLGQLMPGTARDFGVSNAYDSISNLYATVKLVRGHLEHYKKQTGDDYQSLVLMLAAYNAGSGAVRRAGGVPSYAQNYVRKVIELYNALSGRG